MRFKFDFMKLVISSLLLAFVITSCSKDLAEQPVCDTISFNNGEAGVNQIEGIFQGRCMPCHNAQNATNGVVLEGYDNIKNEASNPRLLQRIKGEITPRMPFGGPYLSTDTIQMIENWINCGFPQ